MKKSKISWVNTLSINLNNRQLDANLSHSQLYSTNTDFSIKLKDVLPASMVDKNSDPKANSLAVDIGFVLSQSTKHGSHYVSIPIKVPGYGLFSITDSYINKEYSAQSLEARHILGKDVNIHTDKVQLNGPLHYYTNVTGPTYNSKFHHTEQAFYEYIIQRSNIENLVKRLKEHGIQQGTTIEAIIIDMHSIRYVCGNCEIGGLGLINANYNFINKLSEVLHDYGFIALESLKIIPRISANKPDGTKASIPAKECTNINNAILGTTILEADTKVYKLSNTNTDLYNRSIFISSDISSNTNYDSTRYHFLQQEYLEMIRHGKNLASHTNLNPKKTDDGILIVQDNLFHSGKEIDDLENAFYELSLIEKFDTRKSPLTDKESAIKVIKARQELDKEVAKDYKNFMQIKYQLNQTGMSLEDTASLKNEYLEKITILLTERVLTETDIINFSDQLKDEITLLSIENLKILIKVLEYLRLENIEELIEINVDLESIITMYEKSTEKLIALTSKEAIALIKTEEISFEELEDLYDKNQNMFSDLVLDAENLLADFSFEDIALEYQKILSKYSKYDEQNGEENDIYMMVAAKLYKDNYDNTYDQYSTTTDTTQNEYSFESDCSNDSAVSYLNTSITTLIGEL